MRARSSESPRLSRAVFFSSSYISAPSFVMNERGSMKRGRSLLITTGGARPTQVALTRGDDGRVKNTPERERESEKRTRLENQSTGSRKTLRKKKICAACSIEPLVSDQGAGSRCPSFFTCVPWTGSSACSFHFSPSEDGVGRASLGRVLN